ncbi:MAG: hypothetical protein EHM33_16045 [Chloroflexi bacterium]|nr:MAG: hypothetical protein EHM33_16045 [Chloroflexota bacterium]
MDWKHWIIVLLVVFTAGWMIFDGIRALIVGDYVTPKNGEYAGQLGAWSNVVKAVGIEPRSTLMKSIFVMYGLITLVIAVCFLLGVAWARTALMIVCILGLWFLPIGTVTNLVALILLFFGRS